MLEHAAIALDVGRVVDYYRRHQHAASILRGAGLLGFGHREVAALAAIVELSDRSGWSLRRCRPLLRKEDQPALERAGALLALANQIEHRLPPGAPPEVRCRTTAGAARLETAALADWDVVWCRRRFERAFGRELSIPSGGGRARGPLPVLPLLPAETPVGLRELPAQPGGQRVAAAAVPTLVVVFASDRDFMPYKPVHEGKPLPVAGVYLPGPDINHIAMRSVVDDEERRIIFHEYTHEALSSVLRDPPVWFGEGIAEYYSTFEVRDQGRRALIGRPIASHVLRLRDMRLLPLETLLAVRHDSAHYTDEERRLTFYAESWALVHFLLTDAARRVQLSRFLSAVTSGAAPVDAWREIFGSAVESALRKYVQQVGFAYTQHDFPEKIATLEAKAVPLSGADAQVFLAGLLMSQRRHDEAAERLVAATTLEPGHPRAAVMLGRLELARDDYGSAAKRFAGLPDVEDWLVAYEAGSGVSRMFNRPGVRAREDDVSRARRLFDQVARHRGEFANALAPERGGFAAERGRWRSRQPRR